MNSLENYIKNMKERLNDNIFSPIFIRLANLYYINEQYEECLNVCNIGLEIYPDYLTAKVLALRALIKLEYVGEAEKLLKEIINKIPNRELTYAFNKCIEDLRQKPRQEKIYYSEKSYPIENYSEYSEKINQFNDHAISIEFRDFDQYAEKMSEMLLKDQKYEEFLERFDEFRFENKLRIRPERIKPSEKLPRQPSSSIDTTRIKIMTETIADIFAKQGLLKEAFAAYTVLIQSGHKNSKKIKEKLSELESIM